ncbi:60S ribosomal protein L30 [Sesamum angolense]|uniref:60S ribosomal protein L30 n=1 Tax=Sesamum angolense TaxID=2727404 RepID=A0AAE1XGU2_9LAMI|nr:60S ribosomal protein L30 [Sesamum angolense]
MSSPYVTLGNRSLDQWKVTELKEELKKRKLTTKGLKEDLVKRLDEAVRNERETVAENADSDSTPSKQGTAESVVSGNAKNSMDTGIGIVEKVDAKSEHEIDDHRGSLFECKVVESDLEQGIKAAGLEGEKVAQIATVETTVTITETVESVTALSGSNLHSEGTNEDGDAAVINKDGLPHSQEDAKLEPSDPHSQLPQVNESSAPVAPSSGPNLHRSETQGDATVQMENDDAKCLQPDSSVLPLKYQVPEVDPNLGFQVTSDSVSTESVSIIEKNELKVDVITDNVQLELDVKHEMVQPSASTAVPDGGESHPMDVEEPLDKKDTEDPLDPKNVEDPLVKKDVDDPLDHKNIEDPLVKKDTDDPLDQKNVDDPLDKKDVEDAIDEKDVEERSGGKVPMEVTDGSNTGNFDSLKKMDSGDLDPPEKLSLDRSSGDDSMEEDILESKEYKSDSKKISDNLERPVDTIAREEEHVDVVGHDIPVGTKFTNAENETGSALTSVKRKLNGFNYLQLCLCFGNRVLHIWWEYLAFMILNVSDKEAVGNTDTVKKARRWNTESLKASEPKSGDAAASSTPKGLAEPALKRLSGNDPAVNVEAPKERLVPPSSRPPTNSLRIDRFLRPFTLKAVQELLGKTGNVTSFWMDHIKTHCYVSVSVVPACYTPLSLLFWMRISNIMANLASKWGRLLVAEFVDPQEVKTRVEAPPASPATPSSNAASSFSAAQPQPSMQPQPSPRQQVPRQQLPPPSLPPPSLSNPPPARERPHPTKEPLPREQHLPARERLNLPPPPPLPEKVDPPIVTLDDLFRKTKATPRIYYLPLSDEQVAAKLKAQGRMSAGVACRMFQLRGAAGAGSVTDSCYFMDCIRVRLRLSLEYVSFEFCTLGLKLYFARPGWSVDCIPLLKKTHESINNRLALVMKSGKYTLGYKTVLKTLRNSKGKLILISNNCPPLRKSEIEYYAMLAKVGVHHYNGSELQISICFGGSVVCLRGIDNVDLGTACGKYFRVSCLSIVDPGDSDIIKSLPGEH